MVDRAVPLVIGGALAPGADGSYRCSTRRSQPSWAALGFDGRQSVLQQACDRAMDALDLDETPMGGWGDSGIGIELGVEGMAAFTRPRVQRRGTL